MVTGPLPSRADYFGALRDALPTGALVVTSLGNASYLWARIADRPENFYVEDAMGLALPLALGLAVAQRDRPVIAVEGDGGATMHLGGLVTVGAVRPRNLTVILVHNGVHAASGGQRLTNPDLDFAALARAAGLPHAETVATPGALTAALKLALDRGGPSLIAIRTAPDVEDVAPPAPIDPVAMKARFSSAIGAPAYVPIAFGGGRLVPPGDG